jgi:hypothetical protein
MTNNEKTLNALKYDKGITAEQASKQYLEHEEKTASELADRYVEQLFELVEKAITINAFCTDPVNVDIPNQKLHTKVNTKITEIMNSYGYEVHIWGADKNCLRVLWNKTVEKMSGEDPGYVSKKRKLLEFFTSNVAKAIYCLICLIGEVLFFATIIYIQI